MLLAAVRNDRFHAGVLVARDLDGPWTKLAPGLEGREVSAVRLLDRDVSRGPTTACSSSARGTPDWPRLRTAPRGSSSTRASPTCWRRRRARCSRRPTGPAAQRRPRRELAQRLAGQRARGDGARAARIARAGGDGARDLRQQRPRRELSAALERPRRSAPAADDDPGQRPHGVRRHLVGTLQVHRRRARLLPLLRRDPEHGSGGAGRRPGRPHAVRLRLPTRRPLRQRGPGRDVADGRHRRIAPGSRVGRDDRPPASRRGARGDRLRRPARADQAADPAPRHRTRSPSRRPLESRSRESIALRAAEEALRASATRTRGKGWPQQSTASHSVQVSALLPQRLARSTRLGEVERA